MPFLALLARPTVILGLLFALSMAANTLQWKMYTSALKREGAIAVERDSARAAAIACSEGTARLKAETEARMKKAEAAARAAREAARAADRRALAILQHKPAVPGDACASADVLNKQMLKERRNRGR